MANHGDPGNSSGFQHRCVTAELDHVSVPRLEADQQRPPMQRFPPPAGTREFFLQLGIPVSRLKTPPPFLKAALAQQEVAEIEMRQPVIRVESYRFTVTQLCF